MAVLETDFLIDPFKDRKYAAEKMEDLDPAGEARFATPIMATEFLEGTHYVGGKYLVSSMDLLSSIELLEFEFEVCDMARKIGATLVKEGKQMGIADTMLLELLKDISKSS